jgi:hypothetical protein
MDVVAGGKISGKRRLGIPIVRERFLFFRIIRRETYILAEYACMREDGRATRRYRFVPLEHTRAAQRRFAGRFHGAALRRCGLSRPACNLNHVAPIPHNPSSNRSVNGTDIPHPHPHLHPFSSI